MRKIKAIKMKFHPINLKEALYFTCFFFPIMLLVAYNLVTSYQNMTVSAMDKRQGLSSLVGANISSQLDAYMDLGSSLATRDDLRQAVVDGHWEEAIQFIQTIPHDFSSIERVVLLDPQAVLMADAPEDLRIRGQSFAYRSWYQDVSRDWQPMVSDVYQRAAEPKYNIISIVTPVKDHDGKVLGILLLQVKLDSLYQWVKHINLRDEGVVYVTDNHGQIVIHPLRSPQEPIMNYSEVDVVSRALQGEKGIDEVFDPILQEQQIVAYQSIPNHRWGIFIAESSKKIFAARDKVFVQSLIVDGVFLLAYTLALSVLLGALRRLRTYSEDLEQQVRQRTQNLETFKLALESSSNHIIITNDEGVIVYVNQAATTITGYTKHEMLGKTPKLWGGLMPKSFYQKMWTTIKDEKQPFVSEITNRRKSGEKYSAFVRISPILDAAKKLIGFIGIEDDISERLKLENKLSSKVDELERMNKLMLGRELKMIELKHEIAQKGKQ